MATITQTIGSVPSLPTPPDPNAPSTFDSLAYPYTVAQNTFGTAMQARATEINTFATQANAVRDEVNTARNETVTAHDAVEDMLATLPDGTINDSTTTLTNTWSASKIASELSSLSTITLSDITDFPTAVSATELGYLDGVTSSIQTQIGTKIGATNYASSTTGGTVKVRLNGTIAYIRSDGTNA